MRKVLSAEDEDQKEENYIESLLCFTTCDGCQTRSNLIQSTIFSISLWCDSKLQDYHLHFTKVISFVWFVSFNAILVRM